METKFLSLEWKASAEGVIEGYGSVSGVVDQGGDIVEASAFAASLGGSRKVKMLREHDPSRVIGTWDELTEDANGLRVKGRLVLTTEEGREAFELIKAGALDGLSIGYRTIKANRDQNGIRRISQAELWEVSLVTFPMNELAKIDAVKAAEMTERDLERKLTRDAGFSRSVAQALMAGGYNAIKAMRDAGQDGDDELIALLNARIKLNA
jgi:uncharacterized protein